MRLGGDGGGGTMGIDMPPSHPPLPGTAPPPTTTTLGPHLGLWQGPPKLAGGLGIGAEVPGVLVMVASLSSVVTSGAPHCD